MVGRRFWHPAFVLLFLSGGFSLADDNPETPGFMLQAGAAAVDITPPKFPVIVNGMFEERTADRAFDKLHSRALVFDDGRKRIAIVVVDSCGLPRSVCDAAKELAAKRSNINAEHICISATHTHSAPSVWPVLGSDADADYTQFLIPQIARGIEEAVKNLEPAKMGFAVVRDEEHTFCRRWIRRPDRLITDPFGDPTARANMHPGHESPDAIGPSGPTDPDISVLSVQSREGSPIAVLANYSMHYFGSPLVSADYFGRFCDELEGLTGPGCVAIMSQGTSGDQMWMDYGKPAANPGVEGYAKAIAKKVHEAMSDISYRDAKEVSGVLSPIAMRESALKLNRRVPDEKRLAWAKPIVEQLAGRKPRSLPDIYAREQILLSENPSVELKLQAIRIGHVCMTAIPNEVFAITGLKLKLQSPSHHTFNISLANGAEGYIPPPEQHALGGYTTWPARSAALEVEAEPKIVEQLLSLLAEVAEQPRKPAPALASVYTEQLLESKPLAYWPLDDMVATKCQDISAGGNHAEFEPGVALFLPGANLPGRTRTGEPLPVGQAMHFAGGRLKRDLPSLPAKYSVEFWFWNALPHEARPVTGYLFSRGVDGDRDAAGDHLGIGGTHAGAGRLIFFNGNKRNQLLIGTTLLLLKKWHHVALVRSDDRVEMYLDGKLDISGLVENTVPSDGTTLFFGGRNDRFASFEGKLDEIAVYDRRLEVVELQKRGLAAATPKK